MVARKPTEEQEASEPVWPLPDLSIYQRMALILAELPAIGKNQRNTQQNFNFRGIDDVLNALNPLLAKYAVFVLPNVQERIYAQRSVGNGKIMHEVNLLVEYTFIGPNGDYVTACGWGEGTDMGDKATSKAMQMAFKYVLFQVFAISTEEGSQLDADHATPEETVDTPKAVTEGWEDGTQEAKAHKMLADRINKEGKDFAALVKARRNEAGITGWPLAKPQYDALVELCARLLKERKEAADAASEFGGVDDATQVQERDLSESAPDGQPATGSQAEPAPQEGTTTTMADSA